MTVILGVVLIFCGVFMFIVDYERGVLRKRITVEWLLQFLLPTFGLYFLNWGLQQ